MAQSDRLWRAENNWVHPPYGQLEAVVAKLQRSGAAATVVAPAWIGTYWHQQLMEMVTEYAPLGRACDLLLLPQRPTECARRVHSRWSLGVYRVPLRAPGLHARTARA